MATRADMSPPPLAGRGVSSPQMYKREEIRRVRISLLLPYPDIPEALITVVSSNSLKTVLTNKALAFGSSKASMTMEEEEHKEGMLFRVRRTVFV